VIGYFLVYTDKMDRQYDLRTALQLDKEQLAKEREGIAREIHSSLMA